MEQVKLEGTWEELMLSLQNIGLNLGKVRHDDSGDLDRLIEQMAKFIIVVHNLFNELGKPAEEK